MRINGKEWTAGDVASRIDHTVLSADATRADIERACALARSYGFKAVFTLPYWSSLVADLLEGSGVATGIPLAFPLGAMPAEAKIAETYAVMEIIAGRPCSVDVVANVSLLKEKRYREYTEDIRGVVKAASEQSGVVIKVILETAMLTDEEIVAGCKCAAEAGVHYAKTSTGRGGMPRLEHIGIMRRALPAEIGIKFSGFGTLNSAELAMMAFILGADLLGSPQGNVIVDKLCGVYGSLEFSA
ncbi:MAG: deoxyribose-phosphate aldolase [Mailhella sp.]|nr:deoxyribose-phosphate aldolase [Mailhella sp.]